MTRTTDREIIRGWWDDVAPWYEHDAIPTDSVHYGPHSPTEAKLNLLGDVKGKRVLELGCGGAQGSIALAKAGAVCTAVDICSGQLEHARRLCERHRVTIELIENDIQDLRFLDGRTFDIVYSAYAFQYVRDLRRSFTDVNACLSKAGALVFSCHHPFSDCMDKDTLRVIRSYNDLDREEYVDTWPDGSSRPFLRYLRRTCDYHDALVQSGFVVDRIVEESDSSPLGGPDSYPDAMVKLVPITIIFRAQKR